MLNRVDARETSIDYRRPTSTRLRHSSPVAGRLLRLHLLLRLLWLLRQLLLLLLRLHWLHLLRLLRLLHLRRLW
jgi:hypothetical protein